MHPRPGAAGQGAEPQKFPTSGCKIKFLHLRVRCAVDVKGGRRSSPPQPPPLSSPCRRAQSLGHAPRPLPCPGRDLASVARTLRRLGASRLPGRERETEEAGTTPPAPAPTTGPSRARMLSENREFFLREPGAGTEWGELDRGRRCPHHSPAGAAAAGRVPPPAPSPPSRQCGGRQSGPALEGRRRARGGGRSESPRGGALQPPRGLLVGRTPSFSPKSSQVPPPLHPGVTGSAS